MNPAGPIRVLVVEDSPVARELIIHILTADPAIRIAGTAPNGMRALEAVERLHPDIVTMDIIMPGMDGLETTRRIMERFPLPIIIVSGTVNRQEVSTTFEALRAGAVAAIPRPAGPGSPDFETAARELTRTVKAMAEIRVVRRWPSQGGSKEPAPPSPNPRSGNRPLVAAMGASTGGPDAVQHILANLSPGFSLPLLVVQHMAAGFLGGLAEWLGRSSPLPVALARSGEPAVGGRIYIAPDDRHLGISPDLRLLLSDGPPEKGVRPAVGHLFRSVLNACGRQAVAVLLTGMGNDGVRELKDLRDIGAVTIAQDRETSVIYGMPGEAVRAGAVMYELSPGQIAETLTRIAATGGEKDSR